MTEMPKTLILHPIAAAYWIGEIQRNSPHLARLERICTERNADYAATVAALISQALTQAANESERR